MNDLSPLRTFDVDRVRADFPILSQTIRGKPFVFLDSAASAQKPRAVIDAMVGAMETQYANVHRGLHWMSERTTEAYEGTRDLLARLINARDRTEIVFTGNSTGAMNLIAHSYGRGILKPGQAVLISEMEHHSNIIPWQMLRDAHGIELRIAPVTDGGELDMRAFEEKLQDGKVGLVAITHMSNVLGTYTPAERIARIAHAHGAKVMFDGSQAVVHRRGRRAGDRCRLLLLHRAQAVRSDGHRRAVGAQGIAGGDAAVHGWRRDDLFRHLGTQHLGARAAQVRGGDAGYPRSHRAGRRGEIRGGDRLRRDCGARGDADGACAIAPVRHRGCCASSAGRRIVAAWCHSRWTAPTRTTWRRLLDRQGIAVRAGHHCAEPLMRRLGLDSTARASFGVYTTHEEIDALADTLTRVREFFK